MNHEPLNGKRIIPGMRLETTKLIEALKGGKPGDVLTDQKLSEICGKRTGPGGDGYSYLQSAIRYCIREYNVVWARVKGANCIQCQDFDGVMSMSESSRRHIHKTAYRSCRTLSTISLDDLPERSRTRFLTDSAQMRTLVAMADKSMTKKLEARNITDTFDPARALEAFCKTHELKAE